VLLFGFAHNHLEIVDLEKVVKLSKSEINLIVDIEKSKRQRKLGAWVSLILIPISWMWVRDISGFLSAAVIVHLIHVYIGVRPDDKLMDLLQRYVNSDAEAIQQLSEKSEVGKSAV
jgi:hypothetical protein